MAVTLNAKGTSVPSFTIGKSGLTLYQGSADPSLTYTISAGDYWFNKTNNSLNVRTGSDTWQAPALDGIDISGGAITTGTWQATKVAEIYGGTNQLTYTTGDILYASAENTLSKLSVGTAGQVLTVNTGVPSWQNSTSGGTVTSVDVSGGTTGLTTSGGPVTSSGTITLTGTLAIANGGSGQTSIQTAMNAFAGAVTSGSYLRGNGTNVVMDTIQISDVPTLNQNTTGSAATLTTSRNINSVAFDGSADITVTAAAGTLTGTTLNATVTGSSLTSVGTLTTLTTSGLATLGAGVTQKQVAMGALNIDLSVGSYFSKTISGTSTITVSNTASSGNVSSFILDLTNGGAFAVTWGFSPKWAAGTAPTLTASGRDVLGFFTYDGGTTWSGFVLGQAIA